MMRFLLLHILFFAHLHASSQCDAIIDPPRSSRLTNYVMNINLDHESKKVIGSQEILFTNHSPDTIYELRFYMYLNAFKNTYSTWIKGAGLNTFGQDLSKRKKEDWGWVDILTLVDEQGNALHKNKKYIQPDDGNVHDETVLLVPLADPIAPGTSTTLTSTFESRLPRTIARSGWGHNDFFLWVHWYPKLGVWEQDLSGKWGWNCHQFMRQTEFYGEFGTYDVTFTTSDHFVSGASGCLVSERENGDGTITKNYYAADVIDFAWCAYPYFEVIKDQWKYVEITLLSPKEHSKMQPRFLKVLKESLEYLDHHVGQYPYKTITIMDPPMVGLRNGFMEYPTFSTGGSFYGFPSGIRTIESLIVHEFAHQYFMGILANNEKEEPWLDEGFVTYFEDRIMEEYYGQNCSLFDLWGFRIGNSELSRLEYTSMDNPREAIVAQPGWMFKRYTKELVYSKTGTMLQSMLKIYGQDIMDDIMKSYFAEHQFTHPRANDFFRIVEKVLSSRVDSQAANLAKSFMHQALYTTKVCDYAVKSINTIPESSLLGLTGVRGEKHNTGKNKRYSTSILIEQKGDFIFPVEVEIIMEDGSKSKEFWNGENYIHEIIVPGKVTSVWIDPQQKILLDINLNNNSYSNIVSKSPLKKMGWKASNWLQHIYQSLSFLI